MQKMHCFPARHPGTTIPQTWLFSPTGTSPSHSEPLYPAQGDTEEKKGGGRQATISAHPDMISTTWEIGRLEFLLRPAHVSTCNLPGACCREASFSTAGHLTWSRVLVLLGFVPPRTPPHKLYVHPPEFTCSLNSRVHRAKYYMHSRVHHVCHSMNSCHPLHHHYVNTYGQHGEMTKIQTL